MSCTRAASSRRARRATCSPTRVIPTRWACSAACRASACARTRRRWSPSRARCRPSGAAEGCVFAPRCELARPDCLQGEPVLAPLAVGVATGSRRARCLYPERVPEMRSARRAASGARQRARRRRRRAASPAGPARPRDCSSITSARSSARAGAAARRRRRRHPGDRPGRDAGLVGESGSGKTTLARARGGAPAADGGRVVFLGSDLAGSGRTRPRQTLRAIQMVFQNPDATLNPRWTTSGILRRAVRRLGGLRGAEADARVDAPRSRRRLRAAASSTGARTSSAAGRSSASPSPAPSPAAPTWWSATSRPRARRLGAGDDPQPARRSAARAERRLPLHLARPRRRALPRRPDRRDVPRAALEVGDADAVFTPPHHPYTEALTVVDPDARLRPAAAPHPAERLHTEPRRPAAGLSFPDALPAQARRRLRDAGAALARRRRRAPHPLSHRTRPALRSQSEALAGA